MQVLADAPGLDNWLFLAAGFGRLAPELVEIYDRTRSARRKADVPDLASAARGHHGRRSPPAASTRSASTRARCARSGTSSATRATSTTRSAGCRCRDCVPMERFRTADDWQRRRRFGARRRAHSRSGRASRGAGPHRRNHRRGGARRAGGRISGRHQGDLAGDHASRRRGPRRAERRYGRRRRQTDRSFRARAAELGAPLDGIWVQHMFAGERELLVTALRDQEFGVMVGCGIGGGMTEVIDDVVFARAPIDAAGAGGSAAAAEDGAPPARLSVRSSARAGRRFRRALFVRWRRRRRGSSSRSKSIR